MVEVTMWQLALVLIVLALVSVAMFLALRRWIIGPAQDADKKAYADLVEAFNALPRPESRAFTTVSVPRTPANPQSLRSFVGAFGQMKSPAATPEAVRRLEAEYGDDE